MTFELQPDLQWVSTDAWLMSSAPLQTVNGARVRRLGLGIYADARTRSRNGWAPRRPINIALAVAEYSAVIRR
jgi:hypothetical protein